MNPWRHIQTLNNKPNFINLDCFILFATTNESVINFSSFKPTKDELDIYVLQFGNDLYVGSSHDVRRRINHHFYLLKNNRHYSKRIQDAYNKTKAFKAFIVMRCSTFERSAEQMIIRLLQPSLNTVTPMGKNERYNNIIWQSIKQ